MLQNITPYISFHYQYIANSVTEYHFNISKFQWKIYPKLNKYPISDMSGAWTKRLPASLQAPKRKTMTMRKLWLILHIIVNLQFPANKSTVIGKKFSISQKRGKKLQVVETNLLSRLISVFSRPTRKPLDTFSIEKVQTWKLQVVSESRKINGK